MNDILSFLSSLPCKYLDIVLNGKLFSFGPSAMQTRNHVNVNIINCIIKVSRRRLRLDIYINPIDNKIYYIYLSFGKKHYSICNSKHEEMCLVCRDLAYTYTPSVVEIKGIFCKCKGPKKTIVPMPFIITISNIKSLVQQSL